MNHKCEWCDEALDPEEIAKLCDRCHAEDRKQFDAESRSRDAYWRHVNQKIDEARGK